MRINDVSLLIIAFVLGTLLGVIATLGVYGAVINKQTEAERQEVAEALKKAQEERDDALERINAYLETENGRGRAAEQVGGEEAAPQQRTELAAAPRPDAAAKQPPETLPVPREDAAPTATKAPKGFGPPRKFGID